jgi:hypothetical protein
VISIRAFPNKTTGSFVLGRRKKVGKDLVGDVKTTAKLVGWKCGE